MDGSSSGRRPSRSHHGGVEVDAFNVSRALSALSLRGLAGNLETRTSKSCAAARRSPARSALRAAPKRSFSVANVEGTETSSRGGASSEGIPFDGRLDAPTDRPVDGDGAAVGGSAHSAGQRDPAATRDERPPERTTTTPSSTTTRVAVPPPQFSSARAIATWKRVPRTSTSASGVTITNRSSALNLETWTDTPPPAKRSQRWVSARKRVRSERGCRLIVVPSSADKPKAKPSLRNRSPGSHS